MAWASTLEDTLASEGIVMDRSSGVRPAWDSIPAPVRKYVDSRVGAPVLHARTGEGGYTNGLAARLLLADGRRVFLKGVPAGHVLEKRYSTEIELTSSLPALAPTPSVQWSCLPKDGPDWALLCLDDMPGGHPDMSPGSRDLPDVIDAVTQLGRYLSPSPLPDAPQAPDLMGASLACWRKLADDLPSDLWSEAVDHLGKLVAIERYWEGYARGETMFHADLRADNLMRDRHGRMTIIDWDLPHQGAPWIEAAFLVPRLISEGHTPSGAEAHLADLLDSTMEDVLTSFAVALAGHWSFCGRRPPMPGLPNLRALQLRSASSAWAWASYRLGLSQVTLAGSRRAA